MTHTVLASSQSPEVLLPNDLLEWIDPHTLARLVLAAVQAINLPNPHTTGGPDPSADFRPHILLGLLTYCYATGIYSSADIELSYANDRMVRHLCANTYPEAHRSRWFRRYSRQSILRCLAEVFHRAWRVRFGLPESSLDPAVASIGPSQDLTDGTDVLRFAAEAEERINRAVRLDCWAFDC